MASYLEQLQTKYATSIERGLFAISGKKSVEKSWLQSSSKPPWIISEEQQVIVLEMWNEIVLRTSFINSPEARPLSFHKDCDNIIFINVQTNLLAHEIPLNDYQPYSLSDKKSVKAKIDYRYQVHDIKQLWQGVADPCAALESLVKGVIRQFFASASSDYFLMPLKDLMQASQFPTRSYRFKEIKEELANDIKQIQLPGIEIVHAGVDIDVPPELLNSLQEHYKALYDSNEELKKTTEKNLNFAKRQHVNSLLDQDSTFTPYKLRDVIMALDNRLLEHFYTKKWDEAIQDVQNLFWQRKNEFIRRLDEEEQVRQLAKLSESVGMKHEVMSKLQALVNKRLTERERNIQDFWRHLMGTPASEVK